MHKNEKWQLFYPNGEAIVGEWWSAEDGNPGGADTEIVGIVTVFLYRQGEEGLEFLWQRRSSKIDRYPEDWDISAGGHVNLNESLVEAAARESFEEIGAKISSMDLQLVTVHAHNKNRLAWVYLVDWTGREDEFHFDDGEVSEVRWVKYGEMDDFRAEYAKEPLKADNTTFAAIDDWLKMRELC